MLFGGTFDPAYVVSISGLSSHLQPTTNKRNAALIQKHLEEAIGVSPSRGLLKFIPVAEDCLASGGMTVSGEMEMAEKGLVSGGGTVNGGLPLSKTTPRTGTEEGKGILSMRKSSGRMKLNVKVRALVNCPETTQNADQDGRNLCPTSGKQQWPAQSQ